MDACAAVDLLREATPIVLALIGGVVVPFVTWQIGKSTPRPEEHVLEVANERLRAKVDAHDVRASQVPAAPVTSTVCSPPVDSTVGIGTKAAP